MNGRNITIYIFSLLLILFFLVNNVSAVNMTDRNSNCNALLNYEGITTLVGGLGLMIFGFAIVLYSIKIENPGLILLGIITVIIGFASLLFGNYIFSAIHSVLC